ncbi:baseplate wedge protein [Pseudomonas phage vB_PcuM_ KLEP17-4]|nr:baseplate wedge protein [Pseudomonas phage vB_PcuM_ KLEP17-4]
MANYQYVNSLGVVVPDTADILADVEAEWREALGEDLDTSPTEPQGVLIAAEVSARDSVARNNAELANQINPDLAGGVFLDSIWSLTRGSRRPATRPLVQGVVLGGQPGTLIAAGSLASTDAGAQFATVSAVIIGSGGTITADFRSVDVGPIAAPIGTLTNINSAVLGWETVTNPNAAALGQLEESDIASRKRRRLTLALQGVALPEAITSRLYALDNVRSLAFRENVTSINQTIDGVLMIPHSIFVCVQGGSDAEIAQALLDTKSLGAGWNGTTTVSIVEPFSGQVYAVQFQRPESVNVFVRVTARFNGVDAQTIIPQALATYAAGELEGEDGFVVGGDVTTFEISGAINQVEPRIFVTNVEFSTDGTTYASTPISVSIEQVAQLAGVQVIPA